MGSLFNNPMANAAARKAQQYAKAKAQQTANNLARAAKNRVNRGITGLVNKHLGNNAQSRALANALKTHVTSGINTARNQLRR